MRLKFDPVAKLPECPDHSDRAHSLRLFAHRRAALLIANAFIQNHPDQLTETMRNRPDGFVVAETRNETTVDDLEDASYTFDGSIGGLIEKARHAPVPPSASAGCNSLPRSLPLPGMPLPKRRDSWRRGRSLPWHPPRQ